LKNAAAGMNLETFDKRSVNQRKTSPLRKSTKGEYSAETGRPISPERAKLKARLNTPLGVATPLGAPSQNLVKESEALWQELQEERRLRIATQAMYSERLGAQDAIVAQTEAKWAERVHHESGRAREAMYEASTARAETMSTLGTRSELYGPGYQGGYAGAYPYAGGYAPSAPYAGGYARGYAHPAFSGAYTPGPASHGAYGPFPGGMDVLQTLSAELDSLSHSRQF